MYNLEAVCKKDGKHVKFPLVERPGKKYLQWQPMGGVWLDSKVPLTYQKALAKRPAAAMLLKKNKEKEGANEKQEGQEEENQEDQEEEDQEEDDLEDEEEEKQEDDEEEAKEQEEGCRGAKTQRGRGARRRG